MTKNQPRPEDISCDDFQDLLNKYPALIESTSTSKTTKAGQKTLSELDEFRYGKAPEQFRSQSPKRTMTHDDVRTLVDWKLRHGKFRPTLMKLVSSNNAETVAETIQQAMGAYWDEGQDASAALAAICKLKGIGPATASLLLSVHDPDRVIFFSDEAFWWLCCGGQKAPIKYNPKEYAELNQAAQALVQRLNVSATDVEKVAYVIMKDEALPLTAVEKPKVTKKAPSGKTPAESKTVDEVGSRRSSTKRKKEPRRDSPERPVRRSKRGKET